MVQIETFGTPFHVGECFLVGANLLNLLLVSLLARVRTSYGNKCEMFAVEHVVLH